MKTFAAAAAAAIAATLALSAGSAQAGGHVNWSIGINLPPVGAVVSNGPGYGAGYAPVYSTGYEPVYGPGYGAVVVPAPVYAPPPPPVVVYRRAPPPPPVYYPRHFPGAVYAPLPIAYGPPVHWHGGRGWRDDGHDRRDDGRWSPRDERRQRH